MKNPLKHSGWLKIWSDLEIYEGVAALEVFLVESLAVRINQCSDQ